MSDNFVACVIISGIIVGNVKNCVCLQRQCDRVSFLLTYLLSVTVRNSQKTFKTYKKDQSNQPDKVFKSLFS